MKFSIQQDLKVVEDVRIVDVVQFEGYYGEDECDKMKKKEQKITSIVGSPPPTSGGNETSKIGPEGGKWEKATCPPWFRGGKPIFHMCV